MAPEYASEGLFSIKSDVYSFGVLTLEIVSGKRTSSVHQYGEFINLLGHVSFFFEYLNTICKVLKLALVFNHHLHHYYSSMLSSIPLFYETTKALVIFFFSYMLINFYC